MLATRATRPIPPLVGLLGGPPGQSLLRYRLTDVPLLLVGAVDGDRPVSSALRNRGRGRDVPVAS